MSTGAEISGSASPRFQGVAEAFQRNFEERGEIGASVCVKVHGETLVDLWGGVKDLKTQEPWLEDTISVVFSCTKAATALCAHILIDRGALALNAKAADYWPEFAQNGKEDATVLMALNHTVGVPALRAPVKKDGYCDWDYMTARLAAEKPFWKPGAQNGYHMSSFGWTVGELVRRVSGKSLGTFFKDQIASPLGLDFHIGLPPSEDRRLATMIPFVPDASYQPSDFAKALFADPNSVQFLSLLNNGETDANEPSFHRAEIGGAGGIGNARALATMYAPLASDDERAGKPFLSKERVNAMRQVSVETDCDATLLLPTRFAQGFMMNMDNRVQPSGRQDSLILGKNAFGHTGMGGSVGFADPDCGLAFSYTMTRMGPGILVDERGQSLIDTCYQSLGYQSNQPGYWSA